MGSLEGLIATGKSFVGYIEKASNAYLDSLKDNRGSRNYTCFARDVNAAGLAGCQAQPWCATFQFALEMYEFGKAEALKHWCMTDRTYVGYNCFSTQSAFERKKKTGRVPKLGALVIFNYSHMGRVIRIYKKYGATWFDCLEGNTSSAQDDRNGGMVAIKERRADDTNIRAFCYIDYPEDIVEPGWRLAADGVRWWYEFADRTWATGMQELESSTGKHKYLFDSQGYMLTGWQQDHGNWYYFDDTKGSPNEGAMWRSDDTGAQTLWTL